MLYLTEHSGREPGNPGLGSGTPRVAVALGVNMGESHPNLVHLALMFCGMVLGLNKCRRCGDPFV